MIDCKTLNVKIQNLDVKVLVEFHGQSFWSGKYKMMVRISNFMNFNYSIKGDYYLIKLAFESFDLEIAKKIAETAWKNANKA